MNPPIDQPATSACAMPRASMSASTSSAIAPTVRSATGPGDAPMPRLSGIRSDESRASAATKAGSQSSFVAA